MSGELSTFFKTIRNVKVCFGDADAARRGDGGSNSELDVKWLLKYDVDSVGRDSVLGCRKPTKMFSFSVKFLEIKMHFLSQDLALHVNLLGVDDCEYVWKCCFELSRCGDDAPSMACCACDLDGMHPAESRINTT